MTLKPCIILCSLLPFLLLLFSCLSGGDEFGSFYIQVFSIPIHDNDVTDDRVILDDLKLFILKKGGNYRIVRENAADTKISKGRTLTLYVSSRTDISEDLRIFLNGKFKDERIDIFIWEGN